MLKEANVIFLGPEGLLNSTDNSLLENRLGFISDLEVTCGI